MALEGLRGDIAIYARDEGVWFLRGGFWIAATYRLGAWAHVVPNRPLKHAVLTAHRLLAMPWQVFSGVYISHAAKIGPGLRLPHPRDIFVPPHSVFGADCSIYHNVTVGRGSAPGVPKFGDRVMLFPGARVLGGVSVGDDTRVGANAVVTKDVPAGSVVSAPPSRVVPAETVERLRNSRLR